MLKLGIIGTGRIAARFVGDGWQNTPFVISVIYNPNIESACRFVQDNADKLEGIVDCTDEWDYLVAHVDAVYVACPHEKHFEYTKNLLLAGKHVLCEKPLVLKKSEADELYRMACEKQVVLMEALKTASCPGFQGLLQIVSEGRIGEIKEVEACFTRLTPTNLREMTDLACGGSFTEMGSYVMYPVFKLLGTEYRDISFHSYRGVNGIDKYTRVLFDYGEAFASCKTGLGVKSEGQMIVSGTKGYIVVQAPWWMTRHFEVRYEDPGRVERFDYPYEGSGLKYECEEFYRRIQKCLSKEEQDVRESFKAEAVVTVAESVAMAGVMENFLNAEAEVRKDAEIRLEKILQEHPMRYWAHRGCSMEWPENTIEAFVAAAELPGVVGIELDIQLTKDGEVVVFHDENVSRVTDGSQRVVDYTLAELKELWIAPGDEKQTRIPTLREVMETMKPYCAAKGLLINIELKTSVIHYEGIEEKTDALVREYGLEDYVVYSSFWAESCKKMKEINSANQTGMLASTLSDCIRWGRYAGVDALHPWIGGMDCALPEDMQGMPVRGWGADEPFYKDGRRLRIESLEKYAIFGITEIITNVPEMYVKEAAGGEKTC